MSLFPLCQDPLVKLLRRSFQATPIRIPGSQYTPLGVIAKSRSRVKLVGTITNFLTDTRPFDRDVIDSPLASITACRSRHIDFHLGFNIMRGWLSGMGLDGASLKDNFSGVRKVSFSFRDVHRKWLDIGMLGNFLKGKQLDCQNPASHLFLAEKAGCFVIDSTINSNNFTMRVEETSGSDCTLNVPAIQDMLCRLKSDVRVTSSGTLDISFTGKHALAFAFTAITFSLDNMGGIRFSGGDLTTQSGGTEAAYPVLPEITPHSFLYSREGMISFDP